MDINAELDHFHNWYNLRLDIIFQNPERWGSFYKKDGYYNNSYYNLPTFEYYKKHCVEDKGGAYDFTVRSYRTPKQTIPLIAEVKFQKIVFEPKELKHYYEYSDWMGTAFNFKQIIK